MRFALLPAVVFLAVACSRSPQTQADPATARTTLRVENQSFLDMNIYVLRGSERIRLGTATGSSTTVLTIPRMVVPASTSLRFLADPIGGARAPVSDELTVRPGDEVTLTIPPG
jgi:hypothetical protein